MNTPTETKNGKRLVAYYGRVSTSLQEDQKTIENQWWAGQKNSKAYNNEKNVWGAKLAEESRGLGKKTLPANTAGLFSKTTKATKKARAISSAQPNAPQSSGSQDPSQPVSSAENPPDFIETITAQKSALTKHDTEISNATKPTSESASITDTTPSEQCPEPLIDAKYVEQKLEELSDTIQTWRNRVKSLPSVNDATIEPMLQEIENGLQWMNSEALPEVVRKCLPFLLVCKASKREKNEGLDGMPAKNNHRVHAPRESEAAKTASLSQNHHPTVKPLKLMSYLITLGSRPGDKVLDPFAGSGTTLCAAKALGRKYIGIELEKEYIEIAWARIAAVREPAPQLPL